MTEENKPERIYSQFRLSRLGKIEVDPEDSPPWIPGPEELEAVQADLDLALSDEFRKKLDESDRKAPPS